MPSPMIRWRCALWFLLSTCLHIICLIICLTLLYPFFLFIYYFLFFFSLFFTSSLPYPFLFHSIFFSDFLLIRSCIYLSDCVRPLCCLCVYTCDKRHWIICTTRENGWSCNKVMETLRIACGVLGDLARSSSERAQPSWFKESYFCFRSGHPQGIWREYRVYEGEYTCNCYTTQFSMQL